MLARNIFAFATVDLAAMNKWVGGLTLIAAGSVWLLVSWITPGRLRKGFYGKGETLRYHYGFSAIVTIILGILVMIFG